MAFFVELLEAEHNDVWAEIVRDFLGVELRKYLSVKPKAEKLRLRALFDTMRSVKKTSSGSVTCLPRLDHQPP
jgi:hypothetical protein